MTENENELKHSKLEMASYGAGPAVNQLFRMAYVAFVFYFYEGEIGLDTWLTGFAYIIFAIWNAVNDPLVGYLTDRPFKFTKKWGRRFPWTMIGGIPWVLSYILIFIPPTNDPINGMWILFGWLVFSTCLFDTFNSIFWVNFYAIFPSKFKSLRERRVASSIITPVGVIGIAIGGILPILIIRYGNQPSFVIQAFFVSIAGLIILLMGIPGWKEDREMVNKYLEEYNLQKSEITFFKTLRESFKQRSFVIYIVIYFSFQVLIFSIQSSIAYFVNFVLGEKERTQLFIQVAFLLGALVSIPIWIKIAHKRNSNRFVYLSSAILLCIFSFSLTFMNSLLLTIFVVIFWGFALGGFWSMERPILSDVLDESVLITGKRQEGTYVSIVMFFNRLAIIIQVLIFAIVHTFTGFIEGANSQSQLAQIGIRLHFGVIPTIFLIIGTLIFWKYYDLLPKKVEEIQYKLRQKN